MPLQQRHVVFQIVPNLFNLGVLENGPKLLQHSRTRIAVLWTNHIPRLPSGNRKCDPQRISGTWIETGRLGIEADRLLRGQVLDQLGALFSRFDTVILVWNIGDRFLLYLVGIEQSRLNFLLAFAPNHRCPAL